MKKITLKSLFIILGIASVLSCLWAMRLSKERSISRLEELGVDVFWADNDQFSWNTSVFLEPEGFYLPDRYEFTEEQQEEISENVKRFPKVTYLAVNSSWGVGLFDSFPMVEDLEINVTKDEPFNCNQLPSLKHLKELTIVAPDIIEISAIAHVPLNNLHLSSHSLKSISGIGEIKSLSNLTVSAQGEVAGLSEVFSLPKLAVLILNGLDEVEVTGENNSIERLSITECSLRDRKSFVSQFRGVKYCLLAVRDPKTISFVKISKLKMLEDLVVYNPSDLSISEPLLGLESLEISDCELKAEDVRYITDLPKLKSLTLNNVLISDESKQRLEKQILEFSSNSSD